MLVGAVREGKLTAVAESGMGGCEQRWRCRYRDKRKFKGKEHRVKGYLKYRKGKVELTEAALRSPPPHHRHPSSLPTGARYRHLPSSRLPARLLLGASLGVVELVSLLKEALGCLVDTFDGEILKLIVFLQDLGLRLWRGLLCGIRLLSSWV